MIDVGYSEYAVAGVMGNIQAECDFDPTLVEWGSNIGFGLCQWSYGRRTQIEAYAASKGVSPSDVQTQLEFMLAEMTPEKMEGNLAEDFADSQFIPQSDYERWKNSELPEEAAEIFCWAFERPNKSIRNGALSKRITWARKYYEEFHGRKRGVYQGGVTTDEEAAALQELIELEWIHTVVHYGDYYMQNGPFMKYWDTPVNYLSKFQCTWWANGRASMYLEQMGIADKYPTQMGNGGDYYDYNVSGGWFEYGQEPRPNSIISWRSSQYGHVAYVEGVSDEWIYISHAGSGKSWYGITKIPITGYWGGVYPNGYIYLDMPIEIPK